MIVFRVRSCLTSDYVHYVLGLDADVSVLLYREPSSGELSSPVRTQHILYSNIKTKNIKLIRNPLYLNQNLIHLLSLNKESLYLISSKPDNCLMADVVRAECAQHPHR